MNDGKHLIIMLIDASGSMDSIKEDTQGGVNALVREQGEAQGQTLVTLIDFSTGSSFSMLDQTLDLRVVAEDVPAGEMKPYELVPRYRTPLYDAIGHVLTGAKGRIKDMPQDQRPDRVTFLIATDGLENASREYAVWGVKELLTKIQRPFKEGKEVREQIHKRGWHVIYMGANQDAIIEGDKMGVASHSSLTYGAEQAEHSYGVVSRAMTRSAGTKSVVFTEQDRAETVGTEQS